MSTTRLLACFFLEAELPEISTSLLKVFFGVDGTIGSIKFSVIFNFSKSTFLSLAANSSLLFDRWSGFFVNLFRFSIFSIFASLRIFCIWSRSVNHFSTWFIVRDNFWSADKFGFLWLRIAVFSLTGVLWSFGWIPRWTSWDFVL